MSQFQSVGGICVQGHTTVFLYINCGHTLLLFDADDAVWPIIRFFAILSCYEDQLSLLQFHFSLVSPNDHFPIFTPVLRLANISHLFNHSQALFLTTYPTNSLPLVYRPCSICIVCKSALFGRTYNVKMCDEWV